jgi:septum site-determining protein MinC
MNKKMPVVIRSFKDGIKLIIDEEASFDEVRDELVKKFTEGRNFFGDATVALAIDGKKLNDDQELEILNIIHTYCNLNVLCIVCDDEIHNQHYLKAVKHMMGIAKPGDTGHFYRGRVTDGQELSYDDGIVILGDVNPGCVVKSSGSIIVLGGLYGEAYAGVDFEETDAFVIALEMSAEAIGVGNLKYVPDTKPKWGFKKKIQPKIAYAENGELVFDLLNKSVLEQVYAL